MEPPKKMIQRSGALQSAQHLTSLRADTGIRILESVGACFDFAIQTHVTVRGPERVKSPNPQLGL